MYSTIACEQTYETPHSIINGVATTFGPEVEGLKLTHAHTIRTGKDSCVQFKKTVVNIPRMFYTKLGTTAGAREDTPGAREDTPGAKI